MKLGSTRELAGLKPVLKDPNATGPDPVYWVFTEMTEHEPWFNLTVTTAGQYNGEFAKTFGHYHPDNAPDETYKIVSGEGIMVLQKKHFENGQLDPTRVDEVLLVKLHPGDEAIIKQEYGHSMTNVGAFPLMTYDDWRSGHQPSDYEPMEKMQGMAYYLVPDGHDVKAVPNPNYRELPDPVWLNAVEFRRRSGV